MQEFRQDYAVLKPPAGEDVTPFIRFLRMEAPVFKPSPADMALIFEDKPLFDAGTAQWSWAGALPLASAGSPIAAVANGSEVRLANGARFDFPGGTAHTPPTAEGIVPIDFNYDFKNDLVLAGAGGVRLLRQDEANRFTDVTAESRLDKKVVDGIYTGAWALDIELDGDLDIVLGASEGLPTVLQNNGDGTFEVTHPFAGISGLSQLVWADLDGDGTPDVALIDGGGRLHIFNNERQGQYKERPVPDTIGTVKAIGVADANNDGVLDVVAVQSDAGDNASVATTMGM